MCVFGELDKMVPLKTGIKMSKLIDNCETKIISNCGHMIIFEKAFELRKLVGEFYFKKITNEKIFISKARRTRDTPYTNRIEAQGLTSYTVYNHMLLPTGFGPLEESYFHLKEHVQIWDVSGERQVQITGKDSAQLVQKMTCRDISKI